MFLRLFLTSFFFICLFFSSAQAATCKPQPKSATNPTATVCLNDYCSTIGETMIDGDELNILACLRTSATDATPRWKSMTQEGSSAGVYPKSHPQIGNPAESPTCVAYTDAQGLPYLSVGGGFVQTESLIWYAPTYCNPQNAALCRVPPTPCTVSPRGLLRSGSRLIPWTK